MWSCNRIGCDWESADVNELERHTMDTRHCSFSNGHVVYARGIAAMQATAGTETDDTGFSDGLL